MPSLLRTGTRRSSCSIAPMANSASAPALAVPGRTISMPARREGLEVQVLGAGAQPADGAQHRREVQRLRVQRHRWRRDQRAHVEQGLAQRARIAFEFRRKTHRMARVDPLQDLGFDRLDDQDIHVTCASALRGPGMYCVPQ